MRRDWFCALSLHTVPNTQRVGCDPYTKVNGTVSCFDARNRFRVPPMIDHSSPYIVDRFVSDPVSSPPEPSSQKMQNPNHMPSSNPRRPINPHKTRHNLIYQSLSSDTRTQTLAHSERREEMLVPSLSFHKSKKRPPTHIILIRRLNTSAFTHTHMMHSLINYSLTHTDAHAHAHKRTVGGESGENEA